MGRCDESRLGGRGMVLAEIAVIPFICENGTIAVILSGWITCWDACAHFEFDEITNRSWGYCHDCRWTEC